jgi:adenylate kinase
MKTETTPIARRVQEVMAAGDLVSDDLTIEIVKDRLAKEDCKKGAVLDGFPRTIPQAEALDELLASTFKSKVALVPLFDVSKEETVRRIMGRSQQESRADDSPEVAENRFKVYVENTAPLVDYYERSGVLVRINAEQSIDQVTNDLREVIDTHLNIS